MEKIDFIIEKSPDGYGAYREEKGGGIIVTLGDTVPELKKNIVEAYNLYADEVGAAAIIEDQVNLRYDLEL